MILDSSVLIKAERQGQNARQMLTAISRAAGETEIAMSVVTLIELAHGAARADTAERKTKRQQFIRELLTALPIHPVTVRSLFASAKSTERTRLRECAFHWLIC
jgi:predicted nucleic acid-binding protein